MLKDKVASLVTSPAPISAYADTLDLTNVHAALAIYGALASLYVMQLWTTGSIKVEGDCWITLHVRRVSLILIAGGLAWSVGYSDFMSFQPWPSSVVVFLGVDLFLSAGVAVTLRRKIAARRKAEMLGSSLGTK